MGENDRLVTTIGAASTKRHSDSLLVGKGTCSLAKKKTRKIKAAMMMYCAWNLWKERNRRVFEQKIKSPAEEIQEIKHEVHTRKLACLGPELS